MPTLATADRFELVFWPESQRRRRPGEYPVVHGPLWHQLLAARLGIDVHQVERWCDDPALVTQTRSRAIAAVTDVPLAELRARLQPVGPDDTVACDEAAA